MGAGKGAVRGSRHREGAHTERDSFDTLGKLRAHAHTEHTLTQGETTWVRQGNKAHTELKILETPGKQWLTQSKRSHGAKHRGNARETMAHTEQTLTRSETSWALGNGV